MKGEQLRLTTMRKYENVLIDKLKPYEKNARTHNEEQIDKISKSIKEFGFINPVLIDSDYGIIAGHGRILGAKKIGMTEVPCLFIEDLTEEQKRAYIIADNKLSEDAGWDMEILKEELTILNDMDFDIELTGFTLNDIDIDFEEDEVLEDDYEVEVPEEPKSKLGNIYQLGNHRLMCGDSTSIDDVKKLMNDIKADLFITDPPYNVNYEGGTQDKLKILNDNMDNNSFRQFLKDAFYSATEVMKAGAVFYIWHSDSEGYNFRGACYDNDLQVKQCLIWYKNSLVMGRQDYQWKHEPCLYGWKKGTHNWYADRKQTTVLEFDKPTKNDLHPTMKPVDLIGYQVKNSSKENDIVLDLFGGSGSTLIACEQLNRNCYMMELDPKYIDVIIDRWEQFTGEKALLLNEGE